MYSKPFFYILSAAFTCAFALLSIPLYAIPVTHASEFMNIYRDQEIYLEPAEIFPPGTRIRNIHIYILDPFEPGKFLFSEAANALHWTSKEASVKRRLLYAEGDEYQQDLIDESERILRSTGLRTVERTRVIPVDDISPGEPMWVDIHIKTQDIWSLYVYPAIAISDDRFLYSIEIRERNFLGQGIDISFFLEQSHFFTRWYQQYEEPRFLNSHWRVFERVGFRYDNEGRHVGEEMIFTIERPFFSRREKWSWYTTFAYDNGLVIRGNESEINQIPVRTYPDTLFRDEMYYHKNLIIENKLTRSFGYTNKLNVGIFIRNEQNRYRAHESLEPDYIDAFRDASPTMKEDSTLHKVGLSIAANNHRWVRLRGYQKYSVIEDLVLGSSVESSFAVSQKAWGSTEDAVSISLELSHTALAFKNQISQSFISYTSDYVAGKGQKNMLTTFRYIHHFRNVPSGTFVIKAETTFGERLEDDIFLSLGADGGLRGYEYRFFEGDRRLLFTAEYRFNPFRPFQFWPLPTRGRMALVLFTDIGSCWYSDERRLREVQLHPTAGIGICLMAPSLMSTMARFNFATNFRKGNAGGGDIYSFTVGHAF
jgi:outer membrane protein assembly factor BamA